MSKLGLDMEMLRRFELALDPRHPERSEIPVKILGFGEISTVLEIGEAHEGVSYACKRMPLFHSEQEITDYIALYEEYNNRLLDFGIRVPTYDMFHMPLPNSRNYVFYGIQEKLGYHSIGNRIIHLVSKEEVGTLIRKIVRASHALYTQNKHHEGTFELAIDGQISNWALLGVDPEHPQVREDMELIYIDTSTPLIRKNGVEQLNPELFLRAAPSFLVWVIRLLFLKDVINRYYDFRLVMIDLIANFYKEQRHDLVPFAVHTINDYVREELQGLEFKPITEKEVRKYYKEDAFIWKFYLSARKVDRSLHRLLRKSYPYILPNITKR